MRRRTPLLPLICLFAIPFQLAWGEEPPPKQNGETKQPEASPEKTEEGKPEKKKPEDRYFAITGGLVHTITKGDHPGATILCKNGKIIDIGAGAQIPEKCETLDATGFHVYPGLIAAVSRGLLGAEPPDDTTNVYSLAMTIGLAGGITTAVTDNTAAKLTFGTVDDMIVKRNLFERLEYSDSGPEQRHKLRQAFERVRQYQRDLQTFEEEKKGDPEAKEPDKEWLKGEYESYLRLLRGEATALFNINDAYDITDACELANGFGFRLVLRGATEGWTVASHISRAGASAILTPREHFSRDERYNSPNGSTIENAAILHQHGVRMAFVPSDPSITLGGMAGRDLLQLNMEAAFAVRGGLDEDAAIRCITVEAAQVLGIDDRVGSIEIGKDADFVITDGHLLHYMTMTRWTVVNGRVVYDKEKESLYVHIRKGGDADAPPPDDYWPRRLGEGM